MFAFLAQVFEGYRVYMIVACCIIVGMAVFLFIWDLSFKNRLLISCFNSEVMPGGYLYSCLNDLFDDIAEKMMKADSGYDFKFYRSEVAERMTPLFLEVDSSFTVPVSYFSYEFSEFVHKNYIDSKVRNFKHIAKKFIKERYKSVSVKQHVSDDFVKHLADAVVSDVMESDLGKQMQQEYLKEHVIIEESPVVPDDRDELHARLAKVSYNCAVKDIKLNDGRGLNPKITSHLADDFISDIYSQRVYTHQKLFSSCDSEDLIVYSTAGCCVFFDTFDERYYVYKADNVLLFAHSFLSGSRKLRDACGDALADGHYFLVKFLVDLDDGDINEMYDCLVTAYDVV